ncbi:MAG: hypothetical protein JRN73_07905 [Nitrososphaerota archaeon]|nr:hypothetical protein [Nitrososphaerota archaeon]
MIGDNPFNLVDHLSQERARLRTPLNPKGIARIVLCALESGASGFTFSSTKRIRDALSEIQNLGECPDFGLYPIFPDANELARKASEGGLGSAATELLAGYSIIHKVGSAAGAGAALLRADHEKLLKAYLSAELASLRRVAPTGTRVKAVFLHEIMTELIISFGLDELFHSYTNFVRSQYDALPGVVTRNFPSFVRFANQGTFGELAVLTPFNKMGFQMNPSRKECEESLFEANSLHIIAMSIMAGGHLSLSDSVGYLKTLPAKVSCAVGVSTEDHARETFSRLKLLMSTTEVYSAG